MPPAPRSPNRGLASRTGCIGSVARFCAKTYAPDYVGFMLLLIAYLLIVLFVEPFHRMFFINNMDLLYPHSLVERVPVSLNIFCAGVIPFFFLLIWLSANGSSLHKLNVTILGFLISIALTTFITDSIKNAVGRPRPDLIARCKPAPGTPKNVLVTYEICTETNHRVLHDGWRSFPSGHSSFAFSGLGYVALFLAGQLRIFRPRKDLSRALLAMAPLLGAAFIAISRCEDYRHDVYDVTCGSILGILIAYFSYRRYYPHLHSATCDEPFQLRELSFNEVLGKTKNDAEIARPRREFDASEDEDID